MFKGISNISRTKLFHGKLRQRNFTKVGSQLYSLKLKKKGYLEDKSLGSTITIGEFNLKKAFSTNIRNFSSAHFQFSLSLISDKTRGFEAFWRKEIVGSHTVGNITMLYIVRLLLHCIFWVSAHCFWDGKYATSDFYCCYVLNL